MAPLKVSVPVPILVSPPVLEITLLTVVPPTPPIVSRPPAVIPPVAIVRVWPEVVVSISPPPALSVNPRV